MSYPCTQCGLCCKNIQSVESLSTFHLGDGVCINYDDSVGCTIYNERPDVCRIDEGYKKFFSSVISFSDYYKKNAEVCNQLQKTAGMDNKFRVIL